MKRNILILVAIVLVILGIVRVRKSLRSFDWEESYNYFEHDSDEPMGCMLFDSIAASTSPNGYRFLDVPFNEIEEMQGPSSILLVRRSMYLGYPWNVDRLKDFVKKGNKLMLVVGDFSFYNDEVSSDEDEYYSEEQDYSDAFGLELIGNYVLRVESMTIAFKEKQHQVLQTSDPPYGKIKPAKYEVNPYLIESSLLIENKKWKPLFSSLYTEDNKEVEHPVAAVRNYGKGQLYIVSTPYLFTNYAALDPQLCRYQSQLLELIDDNPVIRLSSYYSSYYDRDYGTASDSPLRYLLEHTPLRWALFTAVGALLLFMLFLAKRRQRVIPYVEPKRNRSLEFVQLVGNIYYQQHDRNDLLQKKYTYFCEQLRRNQLIDLGDRSREGELVALLARTADVPADVVEERMKRIWQYVDGADVPNDVVLRRLIDDMNDLLSRCGQM